MNARLIQAARAWTGTETGTIADGAVLVRNGHIADVGPVAHFANATGLERIDLGDVTLLPGLIDAHLHLSGQAWDGRVLLAHGITTVRDVGNRFPDIIRLRQRQAAGRWVGPHIWAAGPLLDATPPHWAHIARGIGPEENVEAVVDSLIDGGVDQLKSYYFAPPPLVERIVRQAHRRGKRVSCHAGATPVSTAVALGIDCVEHVVTLDADVLPQGCGWQQLEPGSARVDRLLQLFKTHGTWFAPTLAVMEAERFYWGARFELTPGYEFCPPNLRAWLRDWLAPKQDAYHWEEARLAAAAESVRRSQLLVRRFHDAGVPLMAGSDMPFVPPGRGLHYELELLAGAGIPHEAILRMATANPASFLGLADRVGTLAPGCVADLLAVAGDPLRDITATQNIVGLWQGGRRLDRARLLREGRSALAAMDPAYDTGKPPFGIPA